MITTTTNLFAKVGEICRPENYADDNSFFGLPTWYKYLSRIEEESGLCAPAISGLNDIWLIMLAVIEGLLRVSIAIALAFILVGGVKFITSRASPDKVSSAKNTVVDGIIGVVIAVVATAVVSFIAGRFSE